MSKFKLTRSLKKYMPIALRIVNPIVIAVVSYRAGKKMLEAKDEKYTHDICFSDFETNVPVTFDELSKEQQRRIEFRIMFPVYALTIASVVEGYFDKMSDMKTISQLSKAYSSILISNVMYRKALQKENPDAAAEIESDIESKRLDITPEIVVENTKGGGNDTLFISSLTGREFMSTLDKVNDAINEFRREFNSARPTINRNIKEEHRILTHYPVTFRSIGLYRLQNLLGLPSTSFGKRFGYVTEYDKDKGSWIYNFSDTDGKIDETYIHLSKDPYRNATYYIEFLESPIEAWYEY
jgi:hypothetical protein